MLAHAETVVEDLEDLAADVDPDGLDGDRALRLVNLAIRSERAAAALKTLAVRRVEATRAWKRSGHRTMADWLAAATGTTVGQAIGSIETARHLEELPATEAAFRAGEISEAQAREVAAAAVESPEAERSLLETAQVETVKTLRQRSRAVIAAATAEEEERERDERIHRERCLRRWHVHPRAWTGRARGRPCGVSRAPGPGPSPCSPAFGGLGSEGPGSRPTRRHSLEPTGRPRPHPGFARYAGRL